MVPEAALHPMSAGIAPGTAPANVAVWERDLRGVYTRLYAAAEPIVRTAGSAPTVAQR